MGRESLRPPEFSAGLKWQTYAATIGLAAEKVKVALTPSAGREVVRVRLEPRWKTLMHAYSDSCRIRKLRYNSKWRG